MFGKEVIEICMIKLITGDHPRHQYFAKIISENNIIDTWVIQSRENFKTNSYEDVSDLSKLEKLHFQKRDQAENLFFKDFDKVKEKNIKNIIKINKEDLYNQNLVKNLKYTENLIFITYGFLKLNDDILDLFKLNKMNLHGGLSPWYRGSATHFWPSYLLEPEYTGMTLHNLSKDIDGGNIIHQTSVKLNSKDNLHENACRCVKEFIMEFSFLLSEKKFLIKNILELSKKPQVEYGHQKCGIQDY